MKDELTDEILTERSPEKIKFLSVRGGLVLSVTQVFRTILQTVSIILIARYFLTPEDFGFFGIVFAVLSFLFIFKDGGLSVSAIQAETLTKIQLSTLFWINLLLGFLLAIISAISTYILFLIYADERILLTGFIFSLTFIFSGVSTQTQALIQRQMRFVAYNIVETISVVLAVCTSFLLAWKTKHPAALAAFHLVFEISQFVGSRLISDWKLSFKWNLRESKHFISLGGELTFYEFLTYIKLKSDNLIIGLFAGIAELGFYERAYQVLLVPLEQFVYPLSKIVQSSLSRLQNQPEHFRRQLLRWILLSTSITMPIIACLFGVIDELIPCLLGDRWAETAVLYKALAAGAFVLTFNIGWIFIPLGRIRRQIYLNIFSTAFLLAGYLIGIKFGAFGVAAAYSICRIISFIPTLIFICKDTPVKWQDILRTLRHPAFASLTALGVLIFAQNNFFAAQPNLLNVLRDVLFYGFCYLLIWVILPNGVHLLRNNFLLAWKIVFAEKE